MARYGFLMLFVAGITFGADVRLSNDSSASGGYTSAYTLGTGQAYTDAVLQECSKARGRQNEPSVAVNPRDTRVLIGSSNDYCGVYAGSPDSGPFVPSGPIWLGYYRSENSGTSFQSSLVPGYPGDTSPYAALAAIRTASAGDPVIAWDKHGRVFMGAESSDDPAGSKKGFGDVWIARYANPGGDGGDTLGDGKQYLGTVVVAKGSAGQNYSGKFNDKTAIEADRTSSACEGNVYFAWSRFNQIGSNIYFSRSTDHGASFSNPVLLTSNIGNVQDPDISVTGNGHVYVTFDLGATQNGQPNGVAMAKSTDCGKTFSKPVVVSTYIPYNAQDTPVPQPVPAPVSALDDPLSGQDSAGSARDCGDFASACQSGYTFFRRVTSTRSTADQYDSAHEWVYLVYDATKPGTEVASGTTYGSVEPGVGSQSAVYFVRVDGATGVSTTPALIDDQGVGHQTFPDISADGGVLHVIWWDSRNDPSYSPMRPIGNDAAGNTYASLDVWSARSNNGGASWTSKASLNATTSNPNFEQFSNRVVPFAGDYLWVTSLGEFSFAAWTDWRNTVAGIDPREPLATDGADVKQCRTFNTSTSTWTSDQCPHEGGVDQNIYGAPAQ